MLFNPVSLANLNTVLHPPIYNIMWAPLLFHKILQKSFTWLNLVADCVCFGSELAAIDCDKWTLSVQFVPIRILFPSFAFEEFNAMPIILTASALDHNSSNHLLWNVGND